MVRQYRERPGKALPMGQAPAAMTQNNGFYFLRGKLVYLESLPALDPSET